MILLIDNYDSFSYNLYQLIGSIDPEIRVIRNDQLTVEEIRALKPDRIVLSPGPGRPEDAGVIIDVVKELGAEIPILGVCLGHQAICAAFARRDSLREMDKFRPWVLRILTNKCYDACRKRRNTVDLEAAGEVPAATGLDTAERLSLWQAVMSLSDDLRATVTLFYYDGMSVREIGGILGISEAAVKTRLRRGRERLRLLLDEK